MDKEVELRQRIAEILRVNESDIDADYIINIGKLKTSAGTVILSNLINKVYNKKVNCRNLTTFGELLARINGDEYIAGNKVNTRVSVEKPSFRSFGQSGIGVPVCGIDIQEIDIFPELDDYWSDAFYTENFSKDEIAYCVAADSPRHSFAARWCVKEALYKCGEVYRSISMKDIQIVKNNDNSPRIEIWDGEHWGTVSLACSMSHAENYAVGMVTGFSGR